MSEPQPVPRPEPAQTPSDSALYAAIDVGTNSVKLTVADLGDTYPRRIVDQAIITRLGEGMQAQGNRLREIPMRRTIDAIADFVELAHRHRARRIAAVGTAALRDAENRDEFLRRVHERCGLDVEVIPGEEEARLSYLAVRRDPHWRGCGRLVVLDIGGGSTEVIEGETNQEGVRARRSVNVGAVKLTELYLKSDPPTITQLADANRAVAEAFAQVEFQRDAPSPFHAVGVGGTMTNLGSMDRNAFVDPETLHGHTLHADALEREIARLASSTVAERKKIPGLDPKRADIILGGAILLSQALARIGSASVDVSTRGLRWGVLYDRFLP